MLSMKHHTYNQNTVTKQCKGLNGDLKPEHKKIANRTMLSPTTDIDRHRPSETG